MRCKWETIMERTQRWGVREAEDLILLLWPRGTLPPFNFEREEHFHPLSKHLFGDGVLPEPLCSVEKQCISAVFFLSGLRQIWMSQQLISSLSWQLCRVLAQRLCKLNRSTSPWASKATGELCLFRSHKAVSCPSKS